MPLIVFGLRILLSAVFAVAAVGKFLDRPGSRRAFVEFGLPERVAPVLAILLPLAELVVAVLLLPPATVRFGAIGALGLLVAFTAGIAYNLARGRHPDCHCFGQIYSAPAGPSTLLRNGLLAAAAGAVLALGWDDPGPGPLDWAAGMSAGELGAIVVGLIGLIAVVVLAWFTLQLAASVGRLQLALDEIRDRPAMVPGITRTPVPPAGLPIGRVAPSFELDALDGMAVSLAGLLDNRMLMLAFVDPDCAPCRGLLPDLARWQKRDDLAVVPISRGSRSANRRELRGQQLRGVLLQHDREVAALYEVTATPSAVLVAPDGRIASPIAAGPEAIRDLAARAPRVADMAAGRATSVAANAGNGHVHAAGLAIGARVPEVDLRDLDGEPVRLAGKSGRETVVLFWRPSCSFCARIVPEVKAWAASARTGRTDLLLVALDDREANAALDLGARIALDPEMKAFDVFGASGTPVAVKVDRRGRVASALAVGTDQVRGLATAAGLGPPA